MGPMGMMGGRGFALNTMLNQMDSLGQHVEDRMKYKLLRWLGIVRGPVAPKPVVFVIGATNRPDVLDPALVRPGRLDRRLNVYEPDGEGRRDILQHYLKMKAHDPEIPVELMVGLRDRWKQDGGGTVVQREGNWFFVNVQFNPEWGKVPELREDVRVRRGLRPPL